MPSYNSIARVPFKHGGSVTVKWITPPGKRRRRTDKASRTRGARKKINPQWLEEKEKRAQRQKEYIKKHGKPEPRRKTLAVTDKYKDVREQRKFSEAGFKPLRAAKAKGGRIGLKEGGGGTYGGWPKGGPSKPRPRPLPSPGRPDKPKKWELPKWDRPSRKIPKNIRDKLKDLTKKGRPSPGRPGGKGKESPDKRWNKGDKFMTPLRAKKAIGGAVKTIPKITKRFLDFIKTGKHVDKHGVKVNVPKAAERLTGRPHVDHGKRKRIKHLGKGKAEGGRIGLKHGGSVGAAVRGHGAEIK